MINEVVSLRSALLVLAVFVTVLPAPSLTAHVAKLVALSAIFVVNQRWGEVRVWYAFALIFLIMLVSFVPVLHLWNSVVVPATGFALIAYFKRDWLAAERWLVRGHASKATWVLAAITVPLSAIALFGWAQIARPDLTMYSDMIPGTGVAIVIGAAILFSLFNAFAEEIVFRGVLWQALSDTGLAAGVVLAIQAIAFGVLHFHGVPSGLAGVGLATVYGAALGGIRLLSKGLLMPIVVHIFADLAIFMIIMRLAERW